MYEIGGNSSRSPFSTSLRMIAIEKKCLSLRPESLLSCHMEDRKIIKNEILLHVKDTFANQKLIFALELTDEEYAHFNELNELYDNPWVLEEDPLAAKLREIASEQGDLTGVNCGEWELCGWEVAYEGWNASLKEFE